MTEAMFCADAVRRVIHDCSSEDGRAVVWAADGTGYCGRHLEAWHRREAENESPSAPLKERRAIVAPRDPA